MPKADKTTSPRKLFTIRLSTEERELLEQAAARLEIDLTAYIRSAALRQAKSDLKNP